MSDVDTSTCLTKAQAAQVLGTSTKGVERAVQAGELVQHWRRQPGTPDVAVYFPDEVAALVEKRAQARRRGPSGGVLVRGPAEVPTNGNGHHGSLTPVGPPAGDVLSPFPAPIVTPREDWILVRVAPQGLASQTSQTSQTDPAYVPLPEALRLSGVSRAELRKAVQAGEVKVRGRRYRRTDVEAL